LNINKEIHIILYFLTANKDFNGFIYRIKKTKTFVRSFVKNQIKNQYKSFFLNNGRYPLQNSQQDRWNKYLSWNFRQNLYSFQQNDKDCNCRDRCNCNFKQYKTNRFKKHSNNDKSKEKERDYKDKNHKIFIVHFNNDINSSFLSNLQSLSLIRSDNIDDIFILENNLYIFISKHCIYNYNKVFCLTEVKTKHKKNCIYIKTAKYKAQLKAVSKIKHIYRLYQVDFNLYNILFRYLTNGYIGTEIETTFKSNTIETVHPIQDILMPSIHSDYIKYS